MLAYRGDDNRTIQYVPVPTSTYDSDGEPLITPQVDEEALMNFTATGRPIPGFKQNALQSMGGDMFSLPQLLPKQYTDESIIPAIVTNVIASPSEEKKEEGSKERRKSFGSGFMQKLKGSPDGKKKEGGNGFVKVVFMPRREYKKFFARGLEAEYIGSEPERRWTETELDEMFGMYRPVKEEKKGFRPFV
jgi:hypothetical protein